MKKGKKKVRPILTADLADFSTARFGGCLIRPTNEDFRIAISDLTSRDTPAKFESNV